MKITILIIGLVMAAVIGLQSFAILTHPFTSPELDGPASLGIIVALLATIGSGFAMSMLPVSLGCFGVGGVMAVIAGGTTEFHDLRLWGGVVIGLAVLSFFANRGTALPGGRREPFVFGSYQQAPADFEPAAEKPIEPRATVATVLGTALRPVAPSPAAEATMIEQLERLAALRASGALSEAEFIRLKTELLPRAQP